MQSNGSKGVNSVQVAAVDTKEAARIGGAGDNDRERGFRVKPGEPEPIVFPREGMPLDKRPVALKKEQALQMYAAYGGRRKPDNEREREQA